MRHRDSIDCAIVSTSAILADYIHTSNPFVHASLVEVQGLQREYDRWVGYRERASRRYNCHAASLKLQSLLTAIG